MPVGAYGRRGFDSRSESMFVYVQIFVFGLVSVPLTFVRLFIIRIFISLLTKKVWKICKAVQQKP